ncbi:MAG: 6-phosphogluconolactonase [Oceanipulchritudo sp.]
MEERKSIHGTLRIGRIEELFERMVDILETGAASFGNPYLIGLTGGSTPRAFYQWAAREQPLSRTVLDQAVWSVSDERMVPLADPESNFGTADREFLTPLGVAADRKFPWPVQVDPHSAALVHERKLQERFGMGRSFDICFLGMGEDGHTASIFPGSPLLIIESGNFFAPVEVPGKGWRLSITPDGLRACGRIVVMVTGEKKAQRLKEVLEGPGDAYPVQILRGCANKVEWLVDETAGSGLI